MFIAAALVAVCVVPRIDLEIVPPRAMSPVVARTIVEEAGRIWLPYGIVVREGRGPSALSVRIAGEAKRQAGGSRWASPLGATPFSETGEPGRVISLFYDAAIDLMANTLLPGEPAWHWVIPYQREIVGRVLGRALAHEIGHYLLRSPEHSATGLMQAQHSIVELAAEDRQHFDLTAGQVERLARPAPDPGGDAAAASASCS